MSGLCLYGAPYSVYVRICRIALAEKGLAYDLEPVDVFSESAVPADYLVMNPFGRIPTLDHDGFVLFETDAIVNYLDETFEGPPLLPGCSKVRARSRQIMRIADTVLYTKGVWGLYVAWSQHGTAGDPTPVRQALQIIDGLAKAPYLTGVEFSMADAYVYAMLRYIEMAPAGAKILGTMQNLQHWMQTMAGRESVSVSRYDVEPC